jgi:molybdate transport system substrate-binding protein
MTVRRNGATPPLSPGGRLPRAVGIATALLVAALLAACGSDDDSASGGEGGASGDGNGGKPRLVVSAASSMSEPLEDCSRRFEDADVRLSFAGSDQLAAQIRQGLEPDVYAAASTALPMQLHEDGLLGKPVEFASNTLVVAVPKDSEIEAVEQAAAPSVKVAVGSESVPIGAYTRELIGRLPEDVAAGLLANMRSNEPDVAGILGKLTQGAADAGFVYASDVRALRGKLRAIPLPGELQPAVVYAAGVVEGSEQPQLAREYVDGLVGGDCYETLQRAGFGAIK